MLINNFADDVDALAFWDIISEQVKKCELSTALCLTEKGLIHLKNKQIDKTKVSVIELQSFFTSFFYDMPIYRA